MVSKYTSIPKTPKVINLKNIYTMITSINEFKSNINENRISMLNDAIRNLVAQIQNKRWEMENDPELIADTSGPLAQKYGQELNELEEQLAKEKAKLDKIMKKQRAPGKPKSDSKKILLANAEDIRRSRRIYPERTIGEQAAIYKKWYNITDDENTIANVLVEIGDLLKEPKNESFIKTLDGYKALKEKLDSYRVASEVKEPRPFSPTKSNYSEKELVKLYEWLYANSGYGSGSYSARFTEEFKKKTLDGVTIAIGVGGNPSKNYSGGAVVYRTMNISVPGTILGGCLTDKNMEAMNFLYNGGFESSVITRDVNQNDLSIMAHTSYDERYFYAERSGYFIELDVIKSKSGKLWIKCYYPYKNDELPENADDRQKDFYARFKKVQMNAFDFVDKIKNRYGIEIHIAKDVS